MDSRWAAAGFGMVMISVGCGFNPGTPLARAAAEGRMEELRALIGARAAVNDADGRGITPLIAAARSGQVAAVTLLLAAGADPARPGGRNGWTPLMHAIHTRQDGTARLLLEGSQAQGHDLDGAIVMAAGYGNAEMVRALLARGADPRVFAGDGLSALTNAVGGAWDIDYDFRGCQAHAETVRALLQAAPDLEVEDTFWGRYARSYARRRGCSEIETLVERKKPAARE